MSSVPVLAGGHSNVEHMDEGIQGEVPGSSTLTHPWYADDVLRTARLDRRSTRSFGSILMHGAFASNSVCRATSHRLYSASGPDGGLDDGR